MVEGQHRFGVGFRSLAGLRQTRIVPVRAMVSQEIIAYFFFRKGVICPAHASVLFSSCITEDLGDCPRAEQKQYLLFL